MTMAERKTNTKCKAGTETETGTLLNGRWSKWSSL